MVLTIKKRIYALVVSVMMISVLSLIIADSYVLANGHNKEVNKEMKMEDEPSMQNMEMEGDSSMQGMQMEDESSMQTMNMGGDSAMRGMQMGVTDTWQDKVNKVSYPVTAALALFAAWICFMLIRATGLIDKFALITAGLALILIQSILGVLFYTTNGTVITMPMLMFVMSFFNSLAMLFIGIAFFRWNRMIRS